MERDLPSGSYDDQQRCDEQPADLEDEEQSDTPVLRAQHGLDICTKIAAA